MNGTTIQTLDITKFRGLNHLSINDLSRINVFVGANNSGKTSVLEAIKLMSAPRDLGQMVYIALLRTEAGLEIRKRNLISALASLFQQERSSEDAQELSYSIKMSMTMANHQYHYEADGTIGDIVTSLGEHHRSFNLAIATSVDQKKTFLRRSTPS